MFDIGVNLTSSQFAKDRDDVVARAFDAGVNGLLITGTNLRESQQAQKLARQYSSCWSTAGVHPHDSSQWQAATEEAIIELAAQPEVVAIGECGLDFNRNFSTPEEQERAFVAQLRIAADLNMPVFMHCRDAHERFMTLLELRELLPLIPAEKLLIETDAPYLLPRDLTPKPSSRRNEPAHLPHILQRIAHWRGEDAAWLAATTDANVKTLFGIAF
ncbi:TPA: TatD family hydrolase [Escherichia coli]